MKKLFENSFTNIQFEKVTVVTLCLFLVGLFFAVSCGKHDNSNDNSSYPNIIPITDYYLAAGCDWDFTNVKADSVYVINSHEEYVNFISLGMATSQSIDFSQYSLLLVHGNAINGSIAEITKKLIQHSSDKYELNVKIQLNETDNSKEWHVAVTVPKIAQNAIALNINYIADGAKILMLKVDFLTNTFEGGKEFVFFKNSETFTITNEYNSPLDFGDLKLIYQEINEKLFFGTIIWMGKGEMEFPENLLPPEQFDKVVTRDYVYPVNGFETVFNYNTYDTTTNKYDHVWSSVQAFVMVREYLSSNPSQKVKIFLYTPSVGVGNPADWYWIMYLKQ